MKKEEISEFCQLNLWVLFANNTEIIITNMRTKASREESVSVCLCNKSGQKLGLICKKASNQAYLSLAHCTLKQCMITADLRKLLAFWAQGCMGSEAVSKHKLFNSRLAFIFAKEDMSPSVSVTCFNY